MSFSAFTDKNHQPTPFEMQIVTGSKLPEWEQVIKLLRDNYSTQEDIKFLYGKKYGWAMRYRIKGKLLASLYPAEGGFTVQLILSQKDIKKALDMNLGRNVRDTIEKATTYPEGKWLFIAIKTEEDIRDVKKLLAIKTEK